MIQFGLLRAKASVTFPLRLEVDCGNQLRLSTSFRWDAGRYRHGITLRRVDGEIVDHWEDEVQSNEEDWPASPPIQQLSLETIQGAAALLGVGQAGKSHWSISVEAIRCDAQPALKFDIACRCRARPSWLGSSYSRSVEMPGSRPSLKLNRLATTRCSDGAMLVASCEIDQTVVKKYPATFRWGYLVAVASEGQSSITAS